MMDKTNFKKGLGCVLKSAGFASKSGSWYLSGRDSIVVLNLQKSDFDEKFYLNFGVWLKSLGAVEFPAENKCHIQARLTSLFPGHAEAIDRACMAGGSKEDSATFAEFLESEFVPFCNDCLRIEGLRSKLEADVFKRALIMKTAKDALTQV
ncbi:DUF4304 domain-containing protein [Roseateles sp. SL47]|uniref:DUF4304 domain-containing protein n=1 Tax=Roseateles sp. SL47 TaxID=2995138 RepID=UPI00227173F7|nr:DUF4304 domain-containing protein [Roseateles sp. SL47]WAC71441.1 DUF4304 domain-containing protein [Roseateles sp. SL47]